MGCDIHMFLEYKVNDGEWQAHPAHKEDSSGSIVELGCCGRDYKLFAKLAGVRGEGPRPLGIPDDISPIINKAIEFWSYDGHSHSYISIEDFEKLLINNNYEPHNNFYNLIDYNSDFFLVVRGSKKHAEELKIDNILLQNDSIDVKHRIIFFFDN